MKRTTTVDRPATVRRAEQFAARHRAPRGFVMPNAWDPGSAILLAAAGSAAIGTTSAGIAFSLGRPDYAVPRGGRRLGRDEMLERIREITTAVDVPVSGDLEAGYGDSPAAVAETLRLAIEAGLAGGNIEDYVGGGRDALYDETLAAERVAAAREAIDHSGVPFVLTARTDVLQLDPVNGMREAIRRANLYRRAGADCLYAPGASDLGAIATLANEIEGPLNVVLGLTPTTLTVAQTLDVGVARISVGGAIARAALAFVRRSAHELLHEGTLRFAEDQIPQAELNTLFAGRESGSSAVQTRSRNLIHQRMAAMLQSTR